MRKFSKCFITGITGSGGSYLAEKIFKEFPKIKIIGSYRFDGYKRLLQKKIKKIKLIKLDLQNYKKTRYFLNKIKPDVIFHFASNADVRASFDNPINFSNNNNSITINLLEAVRRLTINPVIIIVSSSEVYGNVSKKDIPLKENQRFNPASPYAATKAFQDFISQIYYKSFGLRIIITRMFSYTNARRPNLFQTAFAKQIISIEKGKQKILTHGNLNSVRTFIDIDDAMNAYWLAATKGKIGEIYNIGGSKIISVKNFLNKLITRSRVKILTKTNPALLRPNDVTLQIADSKKFKLHTGWREKIKFEDSVDKFINECRKLYN
jgi:GDP-4-dehydro-6-deoxy-D-mannose reductase